MWNTIDTPFVLWNTQEMLIFQERTSRSGIINKISESKRLMGNNIKGFLGKRKRVRNLSTKIDDDIQVIK